MHDFCEDNHWSSVPRILYITERDDSDIENAEPDEAATITKDMLKTGLDVGCVSLILDPNMESGTVCQIGEHWFYFGGQTAEEMTPQEYLNNIPKDDIISEISDALEGLKNDLGCTDEYQYYNAVLREHLKN